MTTHEEFRAVGLDYKSDGFCVSSDGEVAGSPKFYRKAQDKLKKEQRKLRHMQKGSRNYQKQKTKIAKRHEKTANQRNDFLHKKSLAIAKQYDLVAIESLDMKAMANKAFGNGKATMDNGWGKFSIMLEYKLADRGKLLIKTDKWYPSSQLCHVCGYQNKEIKNLSIRKWHCPQCGVLHDRDLNAAINIREEGLRMYMQMAKPA